MDSRSAPAQALRIAAIYAVFGALWIAGSDAVLSLFVADPVQIARLQTWKGGFFIAVTAVLVYLLVRGQVGRTQALAVREQQDTKLFRDMALLAADYFWELDEQFRFRELTAALRIQGRFDWQAYIGKTRWEMPYLGMDEAAWAAHRADLEAHKPFRSLELGLKSQQGEDRWFLVSGVPLFEADGRFAGYRGISVDITAQKRMQAALDESDRFQRILFESLPIGLALCRMDGSFVECNPAFARILGRSVEETLPLTYWQVTPEKYAEEEQRRIEELAREGRYGPYEKEYIHRDGRLVPVRLSGLVVEWKGERLIWSVVEDITERRQAERALRESEELFRTLTENSPDVITRHDRSLRYVYANPAIEAMSGRPPEDFIGRSYRELGIPEGYAKPWEAALRRVLASGAGMTAEISIEGPHGLRHYESRLVPEQTPDGAVAHVLGVLRDITDRRQAEHALREREEQLHLFVEYAPASIAMFDTEMRYLACSRRWIDDYGLGGRDILGRSHYEIFPEIPQRWIDIHRRCLAGATERNDADPFVREDGRTQWIKWVVCPWRRADGTIGGIVIFSEDITEREALRKQIERILENISDAFVALDRDWRYTYVNARAGELFGRDPKSLVGKHIWTEFPEGVGQPFQLAYERAMASGEAEVLEDHYDPWDRWFENRIHPSTEGLSIFFHEITERKQAEARLREYAQRLEALSRRLMQVQEDERRALARELHDEVGQALAALKLNLAALRRWFSEEAKLAVLDDSIGLVEDTIGHIRDRSMDLRPPMLDDVGLAGTLQWYANRLARRAGLPIAAEIAALPERPTPEVESAAFRIAQEALTNVLRHAGASRAEVRLATVDRSLLLTVRDDGRGFDPAAVRPGESDEGGGAGLVGMRERVALLGGEMVIDSSPGAGAEIRVRLPLSPERPR